MDMKYVRTDEEWKLVKQSIEAIARGDVEAAKRVYQIIPLSPETAMAAKERWGAQYLIDGGYNLTWAEDKYGKNFINE